MDIKPLLVKFRRADDTQKEVAIERKEAHDAVLGAMQEQGIKTFTGEDGPDNITGTFVQGTSIIIDEARLRKELGAAKFDKLCSMSLDKKLLEEAIAQGKIDAVTVAACSNERLNAPYVKLTVKKGVRTRVSGNRKPSKAAKRVAGGRIVKKS